MLAVYPLAFEPIYKPKVWGGDAFTRLLGRAVNSAAKLGESWELADLEDDQSRIANGPLAGKTIHKVLDLWGKKLLGHAQRFEGRFPLLLKYLDANDNLSVQVHPTGEVAARLGGQVRVKSEAWYVLEARAAGGRPAGLYLGCKPGITPEQLRDSLAAGTTSELLNFIPVRPGEAYYLPSGTLHALGAGVVVAEVQTPSDVTYRLYDWGRQGRDLHVFQALECLAWAPPLKPQISAPIYRDPYPVTRLVECEYFHIARARLEKPQAVQLPTGKMTIWMVLSGQGTLRYSPQDAERKLPFTRGQTLLLPAQLPYAVLETDAPTEWLEITLP